MMRDHYDNYTLPSGKVVDMKQIPFYSSDLVNWYDREWMADWPTKDTIETSIYIRGVCGHDLGWGATCATGILLARPDVPNGLGLMVQGLMQPCLSTYVPFYVGIDAVDPRFAGPEAADKFQSIATKSFGFYSLYHEGIRAAFDPYEKELFTTGIPSAEKTYTDLIKQEKSAEAASTLTTFVKNDCDKTLKAADQALANMRQAAIDNSAW